MFAGKSAVSLLRIGLYASVFFTTGAAFANEPMTIGGESAERGSRLVSAIPVPPGEDGVETTIPITVVNGRESALHL